ncbi:MAG: TIGR01906 family membrane protein [Firmicutes bacterium]|nr:TIGR01906 family membrane protein [Bacillota bacterium]
MKKLSPIFSISLYVFLPLFMLLISIQLVTFDVEFYSEKYEEYNISRKTGIKSEDLLDITNDLLEYLKGDKENIIIYKKVNGQTQKIFQKRELLHLVDVKNLFLKGFKLRNLALIMATIAMGYFLLFNRKLLRKKLIITSLIPIFLILVLFILMMLDFNKYFTYFHQIFFTNDLWLLDPKKDILIQMLPLDFFYSIAKKISFYFATQLLLIFLLGQGLKRNVYNSLKRK